MVRFAPLLRALGCLALMSAHAVRAQDASPSPAASGGDDLHILRQLAEQQSRQIEALTQQVTKLTQLLESAHGNGNAAAPAAQSMPPIFASSPGPVEPPRAVAAQPSAEPGATHVVAKGETLTVIAKHYKVTVADLLKANKIEDERKLQIGQTLTLPSSAKPAAEPAHPQ